MPLKLLFTKAVNLLNTTLIFVFFLSLFDIVFERLIILKHTWVILPLLILQSYIYGGILGHLVELAGGEELLINIKNFQKNAKQYWPICLIFSFSFFAAHFLFFSMFHTNIPLQIFLSIFNIFALYFLAQWIISRKYLIPFHLSPQKINIDFKIAATLIFVYGVGIFLATWPYFVQKGEFDISKVIIFSIKYVSLFQFLLLVVLMLDPYKEIEQRFNADREVFLINPMSGGVMDGLAFLFLRGFPPVFVVLKALTPINYKFQAFHRRFWHPRYYKSNKLVAITCYTSNSAEAYRIAKNFRKHGSKVVMGGPHVTYLPDEALMYCDSVVIGEAEGVWKDIISDYENNSLKKKYVGVSKDDFYQEIHQELLNSPAQITKEFLEITRGCKFKCHFCTIPGLSGGRARKKPLSEIVELINKIKHRYKIVRFLDNNIYSDPAYAKELFTALKPLKIKWHTQCTIDIAKNTELLALAKESGCVGLLIGYETFNGSAEKNQRGKFAMADKYLEYTKIIKDMNIKIKAHLILGFDSDNWKSIFRLWKFCFVIRPGVTVISLLTPLPGSKVYFDMLAANRITNLSWRRYAMHDLVFKHDSLNGPIISRTIILLNILILLTTSTLGLMIIATVIAFSFLKEYLTF